MPVRTTYCYDYADRLISSSDQTLTTPTYDAHGNMTQIGTTYNVDGLQFGYDALDRTTLIRENWGTDVNIQYYRDVQGRPVYRGERGNNVPASDTYYGYTGPGDSPDYLVNKAGSVSERYLQLPGGVMLTLQSGSTRVYSLPNVHGDIMATVDQTGGSLATFNYDPFGKLIGTAKPANVTGGESLGWVGSNNKMAEYQFTLATIEMGARTYIPTLGRFTRVDPTDGGNENAYVYPPDPVNDFDLDGNMKNGWLNGLAIAGGIAGAIACGASVVCGVAVGIGAGVAAYATSTDHITKGGIIKAAVVGGALASIGGVLTKLPVNRIKIPLGGGNKAILGSAGRRVGGIALHIQKNGSDILRLHIHNVRTPVRKIPIPLPHFHLPSNWHIHLPWGF
jgi:RHS repeat-associated protein